MSTERLKYLSEAKLQELRTNVYENLSRYVCSDFTDLTSEIGWSVDTKAVDVDTDQLGQLKGFGPEAEVKNSLIVYNSIAGMTPSLAREERVWTRLCHVECLEYVRERWLTGLDEKALEKAVHLHFFARTLTECRDDNAIARLWWNVHIAKIADSDDIEGTLRVILKRADIRSNFVERTGTATRKPLARALVRAMREHEWITSTEQSFREFMKVLNRDGGGILFESLGTEDVDELMVRCLESARQQ